MDDLEEKRQGVVSQVIASQQRLILLLRVQAMQEEKLSENESQKTTWTIRDLAAHMATVDKDCHLPRLTHIAAGLQPEFPYYLNTGWDFSYLELDYWIEEWMAVRRLITRFVQALPLRSLRLTGTHVTFGELSILDVLEQMWLHDKEHIESLEKRQ